MQADPADLVLDDVKEFLYVALRSQERLSDDLRKLVESLNKRQDDDMWLEEVPLRMC